MPRKASNRVPAPRRNASAPAPVAPSTTPNVQPTLAAQTAPFHPPAGIPLAMGTAAEVRPLNFIAIDIETTSPPEAETELVIVRRLLERAPATPDTDDEDAPSEPDATSPEHITTVPAAIDFLVAQWQPPKSVTKPETIDARRAEFRESLVTKAHTLREKSALFDEAPIVCIGACGFEGLVVFDGMRAGGPTIEDGLAVVKCGDEREMLVRFRDWLDIQAAPPTETAQGTALIGFNILGFDLPKLRGRYMKHNLRPPLALRAGDGEKLNPVIDLMKTFLNFCTVDYRRRPMIAFERIIERLGLPNYKKGINGSKVPALHQQGRYPEIVRYNAIDVHTEFLAWGVISGQGTCLA